MSDTKEQLEEQKKRWNSRAEQWDESIGDDHHYVNFENGYQDFLTLEEKLLSDRGKSESGLDLGCGTGVTSALLQKYVKSLYILDLAEKMLEVAKKKVPEAIPLHSSATSIPLENKSIDVVISRGVIPSHLPREIYLDFFKEIGRVTKNGGLLIIDFLTNLDSVTFSIQSPKITYSQKEMGRILTMNGFSDIKFYGDDTKRVQQVSATKK